MAEVDERRAAAGRARARHRRRSSWSSASWAPASRRSRARAAARLGVAAARRRRRCSRSAWASRSPQFFDREGEAAFRAARAGRRARAARRARARRRGARRRRGRDRRGARRARATTSCVHVDVDVETAWGRAARTRPAAGARPRARSSALHGGAGRCTSRSRARSSPAARRSDAAADAALALAQPGVPRTVRMLWARAGAGHPVYVGPGALRAAGALWPGPGAASWSRTSARSRCTARRCCGRSPGVEVADTVAVPPGERHKTLPRPSACCARWRAPACSAATRLLAFGGGVVGRPRRASARRPTSAACAVVQVPTTVVAQVDSAYGGKTGVDLPEAKNYVGAFHQPAAVITDPARARDAAGRGAARRLRRGREDRADRRAGRCGTACARCRRSSSAVGDDLDSAREQ